MKPTNFPIAVDRFQGGSGISDDDDSTGRPKLANLLNDIADFVDTDPATADSRGFVVTNTEATHIYADGDNGDDANDGLTELTPKKTMAAAFDAAPYVLTNDLIFHCKGTFTDERPRLGPVVKTSNFVRILVDGGDELVEVDGPWTADIATSGSIGLSSLSLTPDEHSGFWIEILDGAEAGNKYLIVEHDATTFTPVKNFGTVPTGAQFRVVRPKTRFTSSATVAFINIAPNQNDISVELQRLYFDGPTTRLFLRGNFRLYGCIWDSPDVLSVLAQFHFSASLGNTLLIDPDTGAGDTSLIAGFSQRQGSLSTFTADGVLLFANYLKSVEVNGCSNATLRFGSHVNGSITFRNSNVIDTLITNAIENSSGWANTTIRGSAGVGLSVLDGSNVEVVAGPLIEGNTSHGIEVERSFLKLTGAVGGTGNGGAGVYAHSQSSVHISDGDAPTLTGTVGDLSTDGTTEASTWAAIDGGTPVADTDEFTLAKEV